MFKDQAEKIASLTNKGLVTKSKLSSQSSAEPIIEKCRISSSMATYSSNSSPSQPSPAFLSGKYANDTNNQNSKSKTNSPSYQVQSSTGYQPYYASAATAGNATGTANSLLNGTVKVSLLSMN